MDDKYVGRLAVYYDYHNVGPRFDITFERFLDMNKRGVWKNFINENAPNQRMEVIRSKY